MKLPEHIFSSTSVIQTSTDLDKGSLRISEALLYYFLSNLSLSAVLLTHVEYHPTFFEKIYTHK
jgi:hypothetical protein